MYYRKLTQCNRFEFVRQTSRCVTFDSSEGTVRLSMIPLSHFEDDPHYARVTPPFAPMTTYAAFFADETTDRNRRFWKSLDGDNYAPIHFMSLVGQIRRFARDIVGPRATARNTTHAEASQRNGAYTPPPFLVLHICIVTQNSNKRFL